MPPPEWNLATSGAVQVDLRAIRQRSKEVYVFGTASAALLLECSRCLVSFPYRVETPVDACFLPEGEKVEVTLPEESDACFYSGETIVLDEVIASAFHLETPISPLCREACAGLCPQCIKNLNEGICTCLPAPVGPRTGDAPRATARRA
jgi:uncharacterized protein